MAVFREPDISPNESSEDEEMEEMERSGFEDDTVEVPTMIASPARWSSQFNFLSLNDQDSPSNQSHAQSLPISNTLPHEILVHIFRNLSNTRDLYSALLVSRSWCQCTVELLWQKPQFSKVSGIIKMLQALAKKDSIFQYATFVRRLNFTLLGSDLTDQFLLRATACSRLERLTLFGCSSITDEALEKVLSSTPNLVALDITGVTEATDLSIIAAADTAPRLQGVNLGGCKKITDAGISALATQCTNLRRIKLSGLELITDTPVALLAMHCPMLLELDLHNCSLVSDKSVRDIWSSSNYLREFRLSNVNTLSDRAFPASVNRNNVVVLPPSMQPASPENALPPLNLLRPFDHLRMLDLTGCVNLTDDAIEGVVDNCPKIRNLVLAKCSNLTDEAIGSICKLGRYLHYLHLGHVSNITDRAVTRLARACTRLRYIDLACCPLLSDMSVFELAVLPKLRRIGLVRVPNLTDQAIYALGDQQTSLERIHLSYCENISIQAINYLLQRLMKLTHLSLTGIPAFRRPELQQFCRPPPKEFTANQRAAFCVYSGHGVIDLRRYLQALMQSLTDSERRSDGADNGSDADEDDGQDVDGDADVDGGFIDLREDSSLFYMTASQNGGGTPTPTPGPSRQGSTQIGGPWSHANGQLNGNTQGAPASPNGRVYTLPHGPVDLRNTTAPLPTLQLHLNGATNGSGSSNSPLPFPLTPRTSVANTPGDTQESEAGPSNAVNITPTQAAMNGHSSSSSRRRSPPAFLSFTSALRGAWAGGSGHGPEPSTSSGGRTLREAAAGHGPSHGRTSSSTSGPQPLSTQNVSANGPHNGLRQWAHSRVANGASPLPSPSNSAAGFAMAVSSEQPSPPSPRNASFMASRSSAEVAPVTVAPGGTQNGDSRRELMALEQSLHDVLHATQGSSSRGRDRQRTRDFPVARPIVDDTIHLAPNVNGTQIQGSSHGNGHVNGHSRTNGDYSNAPPSSRPRQG